MSLVSAALFFCRRRMSSEMSVADSSWAKRSSSIFASISATGCSNSRNVVFMDKSGEHCTLVDLDIRRAQYSTGTGSRLLHRYQVATERHGAHPSATRRMVRGDTLRPLK